MFSEMQWKAQCVLSVDRSSILRTFCRVRSNLLWSPSTSRHLSSCHPALCYPSHSALMIGSSPGYQRPSRRTRTAPSRCPSICVRLQVAPHHLPLVVVRRPLLIAACGPHPRRIPSPLLRPAALTCPLGPAALSKTSGSVPPCYPGLPALSTCPCPPRTPPFLPHRP